MAIATLQKQIHQLQAQLKFSQSPKQTKLLQGAIARLEEKLNAEVADQANTSPPKIVKTIPKKAVPDSPQPKQPSKSSKSKLEVVKTIPNDSPKAEPEVSKSEESIPEQAPLGEKKRKKWPITQVLNNGTVIESVPGQGRHQFHWKVFGEIQADDDGNFTMSIDDGALTIPVRLGKRARLALKDVSLPVSRYCSLYPKVEEGAIAKAQLTACADTRQREEQFKALGYWIAEEQTLQIQSNFRYWGKRSRNRFYKIPVQDGVDNPRTGFRELKLERDRLNLFVVGEVLKEQSGAKKTESSPA